jgi:ribose-phosphate pyrophosphokinase
MLNILRDKIVLFSGNANPDLAQRVAECLDIKLGSALVESFPDGEINIKINDDIRGTDVFILQSTCPPVNENLMELLLLIDCCKRASAGRVTAVIPYFGYARKDRKDEGRVPISSKLVADLLTTAGADRVLTLDLHSAQIQGFFDIPVDHLYAKPVMIQFLSTLDGDKQTIVAPDAGGIKMARGYAKILNSGLAIVDKRRDSATTTEVEHLIGDVTDSNVIIVDDMISTGGSITNAVKTVKKFGANKVFICATHPVLCGQALEKINAADVEKVVVTDSIPLGDKKSDKIHVVSIASLLADAIKNTHHSESISRLFDISSIEE